MPDRDTRLHAYCDPSTFAWVVESQKGGRTKCGRRRDIAYIRIRASQVDCAECASIRAAELLTEAAGIGELARAPSLYASQREAVRYLSAQLNGLAHAWAVREAQLNFDKDDPVVWRNPTNGVSALGVFQRHDDPGFGVIDIPEMGVKDVVVSLGELVPG